MTEIYVLVQSASRLAVLSRLKNSFVIVEPRFTSETLDKRLIKWENDVCEQDKEQR